MLNKEMNEQLTEFEVKMKDNFIERHATELSGKDLNEVIEAYIRWRHNRYTVLEDPNCFMIVDMYNQEVPIAMISKDMDPNGFNHAWDMAEDLNDLPDQYLSVGNQVLSVDDMEFDLSSLKSDSPIADAIRLAEKFIDSEEKEDE